MQKSKCEGEDDDEYNPDEEEDEDDHVIDHDEADELRSSPSKASPGQSKSATSKPPSENFQKGACKRSNPTPNLLEKLDEASSKKRKVASSGLPAYIPLNAPPPPSAEDIATAEAYRARVRGLQQADHSTAAPVRLNVRKRLSEALQISGGDQTPGALKPEIIAAEIEETVFVTSGCILNDGYKQKFRRLEFNLKDPKNGHLRHRLLCAVLTPAQLVVMKSEELANPSLKEEYKKIAEYKAKEKMADTERAVTSDAFRCGKCGNRKCTYTELQVRRADEPMTVFVTCTICGNRWRC